MEQSLSITGFDAPKQRREDDVLNRWRFAKEIYSIAINASNDWSVRVGIYARWGEGKSTVLRFIENMASTDNHLCLFFNPWEFNTIDDLWQDFILEVIGIVDSKGIKISNIDGIKKRIKYNKYLSSNEELAEGILQDIPYVGKIGIPLLKSFISDNKTQLKALAESLKEKKFIIIFDDLDRANPKLVPQVLYALKEILDLPGFSFILAFDPNIVAKALKNYHIGFDETLDFLDKIIDFPKWLPPPNDKDLMELAKKDILNYCSFIPVENFLQVFKYLPKNPRSLRKFIRLFVGFEKEILRYEKDEIDWTQFLLIQILKNYYHAFSYELFADAELWQEIFSNRLFGERRSGSEPKDLHKALIEKLCNKHNITSDDQILRLTEIIDQIGKKDQRLSNINIIRYLTLTENPALLSWKEFISFLANYEAVRSKEFINTFIESHSSTFDFDKNDLIKELFSMTLDYRAWLLREASGANFSKKVEDHLDASLLALEVLEILSFNFDGFVGNSILDSEDFKKLYDSIGHWLHFNNTKKQRLIRKKEKSFLLKLVANIEKDLIEKFNSLTPWMSERIGVYDSKAEKIFCKRISDVLEKNISKQILCKFRLNDWIQSIYDENYNLALRYILFRKNSPLWKGDNRKKFFKLLNDHPDDEILRKNITEYLYYINDSLFDSYDAGKMYNDDSILNDKILISTIWRFVIVKKINKSMFKSFEDLKLKIENRFNYKLPLPRWWQGMKREMNSKFSNT